MALYHTARRQFAWHYIYVLHYVCMRISIYQRTLRCKQHIRAWFRTNICIQCWHLNFDYRSNGSYPRFPASTRFNQSLFSLLLIHSRGETHKGLYVPLLALKIEVELLEQGISKSLPIQRDLNAMEGTQNIMSQNESVSTDWFLGHFAQEVVPINGHQVAQDLVQQGALPSIGASR